MGVPEPVSSRHDARSTAKCTMPGRCTDRPTATFLDACSWGVRYVTTQTPQVRSKLYTAVQTSEPTIFFFSSFFLLFHPIYNLRTFLSPSPSLNGAQTLGHPTKQALLPSPPLRRAPQLYRERNSTLSFPRRLASSCVLYSVPQVLTVRPITN